MPVVSSANGVNVASAAHRSQKTVLADVAFAANDTFISVYPYDGFGAITAAAIDVNVSG